MRLGHCVLSVFASLAVVQSAASAGLFGHRSQAATPAPSPAVTPARGLDTSAAAVLRAVNAERARGGVAAVAFDGRTTGIAQAYATDMARRGFFSHVSPEGVDPFARMHGAGIVFRAAGETIGRGHDAATAERFVYADSAHRAIILDGRFHHVGIGYARTATDVILVEDFTD